MKRRDFLGSVGGTALLAGCGQQDSAVTAGAVSTPQETIHWKLVTTWPRNFPGLGTGANNLARLIGEMSGGRLQVKVFGAGELVPTMEVFGAVMQGTAEMGHGAAYYWKGKSAAAQFFAAVPFGLTAQEMNAWLLHGGGMELWREVYAPFGVLPLAAGNSGVQMAGWFNREINRAEDLRGLKMRIPGLGGEVLGRAGGTPVNLPGGEIFTSLQSGVIDATEWVGPYNDLAFGLHKAAKYYYYPGWHEPGTTLELIVNRKAWDELPEDLQTIIRIGAMATNLWQYSQFETLNLRALRELKEQQNVQILAFPDDVVVELRRLAKEAMDEQADKDPEFKRVYEAYQAFRADNDAWDQTSDMAYRRALGL